MIDLGRVVENLRDEAKRHMQSSTRHAWNSDDRDKLAIRDGIIGAVFAGLADAIEAGMPTDSADAVTKRRA